MPGNRRMPSGVYQSQAATSAGFGTGIGPGRQSDQPPGQLDPPRGDAVPDPPQRHDVEPEVLRESRGPAPPARSLRPRFRRPENNRPRAPRPAPTAGSTSSRPVADNHRHDPAPANRHMGVRESLAGGVRFRVASLRVETVEIGLFLCRPAYRRATPLGGSVWRKKVLPAIDLF